MEEPIRVLQMIGSLNIGGSQAMVLNLYKAIDRSKVQFDFIIDHENEIALAQDVETLGGKIYVMPNFKGTNIIEIKIAWNRFFKEHPEYRILHSHVRSYASLYIPIAKKYGLKTVIHSHSTSNGRGVASVIKSLLQYPLRFQADYFVASSKEAGEWLFGKKVVNSEQCVVLKNAINTELYRFNLEIRERYRRQLGISEKRVFIHVGRFHASKNHMFLLEVFAKVNEIQNDSVLILVGDGELRTDVESKIKELGLEKAVILLGNRNDVNCLLQAADCFLFPSLWEGLGMVAVEAQAAGLPCICSSNVPEIVAVTENCIFLPLNNTDEWKERIRNIQNARRDVTKEIIAAGFDINAAAKWIITFYQNIIKDNS